MPAWPSSRLLAAAAASSGALAILSAPWAMGQPWLNWAFKPLTTLLIIAYAWPRGHSQPAARRWVLIGLAWSLCGDVALMWPERGFLPGLVSFLLAHLAYLRAFTRDGIGFAARPVPFLFYGALAGVILWQLWPGVPAGLRVPVLAYVACLASMAAQAAVVWRVATGTAKERAARWLAIGGALFLCSDALLATNRFAAPLPMSGLWILATYWLAQWCIARWLAPGAPATAAASPDPGSPALPRR